MNSKHIEKTALPRQQQCTAIDEKMGFFMQLILRLVIYSEMPHMHVTEGSNRAIYGEVAGFICGLGARL